MRKAKNIFVIIIIVIIVSGIIGCNFTPGHREEAYERREAYEYFYNSFRNPVIRVLEQILDFTTTKIFVSGIISFVPGNYYTLAEQFFRLVTNQDIEEIEKIAESLKATEVEEGWMSLFAHADSLSVNPFESYYEGISQKELNDLIAEEFYYKKNYFNENFSYTVDSYDHISSELQFMVFLCDQEYKNYYDDEELLKIQRIEKEFLEKHLGKWINDFSFEIKMVSTDHDPDGRKFYKYLSELLAIFIKEDIEYLNHSISELETKIKESPITGRIIEEDPLNMEPEYNSPSSTSTCLIIDVSGSMGKEWMGGIKIHSTIESAKKLISMISQESSFTTIPNLVSIVSFNYSAYLDIGPTSDYSSVNTVLNDLINYVDGETNIEQALYRCIDSFSVADDKKIAILLSDGVPTEGIESISEMIEGPVAKLIDNNITLYTIGFGDRENNESINEELLSMIAEQTEGRYYYADDIYDLSKTYIRLRHESKGTIIDSIDGYISQDEILSLAPIEVTSAMGDLNITLSWPGSEIGLELVDPKGVVVDNSYPNCSIDTESNPNYYIIEDPIPGIWNTTLYGSYIEEENEPFEVIYSTSKPREEKPVNNKIFIITLIFLIVGAIIAIIIVVIAKKKRKRGRAFIYYRNNKIPIMGTITIGRSSSNNISLNDKKVSRNHAMVERIDKKFIIRDLNSKNGTYVNNIKIMEMILNPADTIKIGKTFIYFLQEK